MLSNPSEQVRECLNRATNCARKAAAQPEDSPLRQDFLDMEKRWLSLARNIERAERLAPKANGTPVLKPDSTL
jgi:hypothetical protein